MTNFLAIRCPNKREHHKYDLCGRLLGALEGGNFYLYCECCKQFFGVTTDGTNVEMTPMDKKERLKLKTALRALIS